MVAEDLDALEDVLERLHPELRVQVLDFARFLLERRESTSEGGGRMTLSWQGSLRHLRDTYTSMELQEKVVEWVCD